jgi:hypothetical protein
MKNAFATLFIVATVVTVALAQQVELKSASSNIEQKNYIAALDDISKAKKKVNDLMKGQLASVLPMTFGEYTMSDSDPMNYGMEGQGVTMTKQYQKPKAKQEKSTSADGQSEDMMMQMSLGMGTEPGIQVTITTNMMMAGEVNSAHSMADQGINSGMSGVTMEAYRVKGYRAVSKVSVDVELTSQEQSQMGMEQQRIDEAQAIVGGALVSVKISNGDGSGEAKKFLELVDFDKLIGIVGK